MILGITGGTGCGKTTLLSHIAALGGLILDCDAIYHDLLTRDESLLEAISARFPGTVIDGTLQRKALGALVFADEAALLDLNAITHSAVKAEVLRQLEQQPALAAIDAIALFESGLDALCDLTVAVTAPREARITRLMARDGIDRAYALSRIQAQHEDRWFENRCDYVLCNNGTAPEFSRKCLAFLEKAGIMNN